MEKSVEGANSFVALCLYPLSRKNALDEWEQRKLGVQMWLPASRMLILYVLRQRLSSENRPLALHGLKNASAHVLP